MKVKVQKYISLQSDIRYGIYVKRWWFPFWVKVDYWLDEKVAIDHAVLLKHPKSVEIT